MSLRVQAATATWLSMFLISCSGAESPIGGDELGRLKEKLGTLPATPPPDPSNRHGDAAPAAQLGQQFFFETRYSSSGSQACATCHDPSAGFQDARTNTSIGVAGITGRHAPTVLNVAFGSGVPGEPSWNFWDGRKDSEWAQALGPPENPVEMGSTRTKIAYLIADHYAGSYEAIFGPLPGWLKDPGARTYPADAMPGKASWDAIPEGDRDAITQVYVNFGKAIAAYERKLISRNSRFDRFYEEITGGAAESAQLSEREQAGLGLFLGKANCVACHQGSNFSAWKFHNIGVPQDAPNVPSEDQGRQAGVEKVKNDEFNCASRWSDQADKSLCAVASLESKASDLGAFRDPTLRNISKTAPYMHTGAFGTLEEVVAFYNQGGAASGFVGSLDPAIKPLDLTDEEQADLVAFLKALDGEPIDASLLGAPALP